jgi:hypothetical protein
MTLAVKIHYLHTPECYYGPGGRAAAGHLYQLECNVTTAAGYQGRIQVHCCHVEFPAVLAAIFTPANATVAVFAAAAAHDDW